MILEYFGCPIWFIHMSLLVVNGVNYGDCPSKSFPHFAVKKRVYRFIFFDNWDSDPGRCRWHGSRVCSFSLCSVLWSTLGESRGLTCVDWFFKWIPYFFWFSDIAVLFFGSFESKKLEFAQDIWYVGILIINLLNKHQRICLIYVCFSIASFAQKDSVSCQNHRIFSFVKVWAMQANATRDIGKSIAALGLEPPRFRLLDQLRDTYDVTRIDSQQVGAPHGTGETNSAESKLERTLQTSSTMTQHQAPCGALGLALQWCAVMRGILSIHSQWTGITMKLAFATLQLTHCTENNHAHHVVNKRMG